MGSGVEHERLRLQPGVSLFDFRHAAVGLLVVELDGGRALQHHRLSDFHLRVFPGTRPAASAAAIADRPALPCRHRRSQRDVDRMLLEGAHLEHRKADDVPVRVDLLGVTSENGNYCTLSRCERRRLVASRNFDGLALG